MPIYQAVDYMNVVFNGLKTNVLCGF